MAIAIKHNGVYRFQNYAYPNGQVLNAYGPTSLANGRNVMLYTLNSSDNAQKWRAMFAGMNGAASLFWLNCELGGRSYPYALDRYTGSSLKDNADVYRAVDSSAADQLIYFEESGDSGRTFIRLYNGGYALTAAPNPSGANGNNSPSSLTQAGNVYWAAYTGSTAQEWVVTTVTAGTVPDTVDRATTFPAESFYTAAKNGSYPNYVGECTWYCRGRFHQVNNIANAGSGDAYEWATCSLPSGVSRDTTTKTLRANSIAVFGAGGSSPLGHVVFIESVSGSSVTWSDCNGTTVGGTFALSNGQIEVRSSTLTGARDGYKNTTASGFSSLFGSGLTAIIYKS